jgi:hypothetical protein
MIPGSGEATSLQAPMLGEQSVVVVEGISTLMPLSSTHGTGQIVQGSIPAPARLDDDNSDGQTTESIHRIAFGRFTSIASATQP